MVIHEALLVAVHVQLFEVSTSIFLPLAPPAAIDAVVGLIE